jgi:hypothetical protein
VEDDSSDFSNFLRAQPSVAVRPCPVLFQLPDEAKENTLSGGLPYRSVFCVLTWDAVLVYDTFHTNPLAIVSGLHYCNLVDAAWSDDGRTLFVCSTDGYVSIVQFDDGELGQVYVPPPTVAGVHAAAATTPPPVSANVGRSPAENSVSTMSKPPPQQSHPRRLPVPSPGPPTLPPCEPGLARIEAPPCKRAKFQNSDESTSSNGAALSSSAAAAAVAVVGDRCRGADDAIGIDQLTIDEPKAKKKRIQPTFIAATN